MVFIKPRIMRDADATESTSEAAYNDVRQQERTLNGGHITLLPGTQPAIPPIPPGIALPQAPPASQTNEQGAIANPPPAGAQAAATPPPSP
jgi:hypothetical protein